MFLLVDSAFIELIPTICRNILRIRAVVVTGIVTIVASLGIVDVIVLRPVGNGFECLSLSLFICGRNRSVKDFPTSGETDRRLP